MTKKIPAKLIVELTESVLARHGKKRNADFVFACPHVGHVDERASARWNPAKAVYYCDVCGKGGGALDLARQLGVAHPGNTAAPKSGRKLVGTYPYHDAAGNCVYEVLRFEPKAFSQRRPQGDGGFVSNLRGVKPLLYRLPEILGAPPGQWVIVVEGERDADLLRSAGLIATTNSGGAGKWKAEFGRLLDGRKVAILPDNDAPGFAHAQSIAASAADEAKTVKVLQLPGLNPKEDVSDWLANGNSIEDLVRAIDAAPIWKETASGPATQHEEHPPINGAHQFDDVEEVEDEVVYEKTATGLVWLRPTKLGVLKTRLTNFTAEIVEDMVEDDGVGQTHHFVIEAGLSGRIRRATVSPAQFSPMGWVLDALGAQATVAAGTGVKDRTREAIQLLSTNVKERQVFVHTGWRRLDDEWAYLHGAGAIGPDGEVGGVECRLPDALSGFGLPAPPRDDDLRDAIAASLSILNLGPDRIAIPLLCAVYRSVLGGTDFSLHFTGATGTGKSELAAMAQSHFGAGNDSRHLPGSWSSTGNALEGLAFVAKDAILVVDDFAPAGTNYDIAKVHRDADRLLRAQGNQAGRQRMRADSTLRPARQPRGMILSTGEDTPRGQSLRSRLLIIEVGDGDVDFRQLTTCQADAAEGLLAASMAGFVRWVAGRYDDVRDGLRADIQRLRAASAGEAPHRRTPEIVANLGAGCNTFLTFAEEAGAITASERESFWNRSRSALSDAIGAQIEHQTSAEPAAHFRQLLRSALESGAAYLTSLDGDRPARPQDWGWRHENGEWRPQGSHVGWIEGEDLFLEPLASYAAAQRVGIATGDLIGVQPRTLYKRLSEAKILVSTEAARNRTTIRRMIGGRRLEVLHLRASTLSGNRPERPIQPTPH